MHNLTQGSRQDRRQGSRNSVNLVEIINFADIFIYQIINLD